MITLLLALWIQFNTALYSVNNRGPLLLNGSSLRVLKQGDVFHNNSLIKLGSLKWKQFVGRLY